MKKYEDDERLNHIVDEDNFILESEIIVFGEFFKKKYQSKSTAKFIYDNLDDLMNDLKTRTRTLKEVEYEPIRQLQ